MDICEQNINIPKNILLSSFNFKVGNTILMGFLTKFPGIKWKC